MLDQVSLDLGLKQSNAAVSEKQVDDKRSESDLFRGLSFKAQVLLTFLFFPKQLSAAEWWVMDTAGQHMTGAWRCQGCMKEWT